MFVNRLTSVLSVFMHSSPLPQGFAFVNYYDRHNAEKAIKALDGYGYHYLILKVEWAR